MIELPGYSIGELVYDGQRSRIYRGRRDADGLPVVLKVQEAAGNDAAETDAAPTLVHELAIGRLISHELTTTYLGLELHDGRWVLIEEDFGGVGLDQLIPDGGLALGLFLELAAELARGLAAIHKEGVVHKDVKPSNLVWNHVTGVVKYIDFGIATRLREEKRPALDPRRLEGSLSYVSPEQTGRLERTLDSRTDLYSLGATLYEMLTGRPLFDLSDPLELIHAHIARAPTAPRELRPEVPAILSDLVLRLLEKNADDRYQTARGLEVDLTACRGLFRRSGSIPAFELGREDVSEVLRIPQKLYGRDRELARVLTAFEHAVSRPATARASPLLLVAGAAGTGKSALVHEISKSVTARRGHFVCGRHEPEHRNVPYLALGQALDELVSRLLATGAPEQDAWRRRIRRAVGESGRLLSEAVPSLEAILGEPPGVQPPGVQPPGVQPPGVQPGVQPPGVQPPGVPRKSTFVSPQGAPQIGPREAQNRFWRLLRELFAAVATNERPLVVFLDDLQWADASSLVFLSDLSTYGLPAGFLLLGAYRSDEADTTAAIEDEGGTVETLELHNLSPDDVEQLVAGALRSTPAAVRPLAELAHEKTLGNPFFLREFLKSLDAEGLLRYEPAPVGWCWDVAEIRTRDITDNVVDLLAQKLTGMDPGTRAVLELAACLGPHFDAVTLAALYEAERDRLSPQARTELAQPLWTAVREGLLYPLDKSFSALPPEDDPAALAGRFRFAHERIRQVARSQLDEDTRAGVHLSIARILLAAETASSPEGSAGENLFEIVDQFNRAAPRIRGEAEALAVAELNLRAGRKAKQAAAYAVAEACLRAGADLLPEALWESHPGLLFELHRELAETEYATARFVRAERRASWLLGKARSDAERLEVHFLQLEQLIVRGRAREAITVGKTVLQQLGVELPDSEPELEALFQEELAAMPGYLGEREIVELARSPAMTDTRQRYLMRLLSDLSYAAYVGGERTLAAWTAVRRVSSSLVYGNHELSATAYAAFAYGVAIPVLEDYDTAWRYAALALELAEDLDDPGARGRAYLVVAYVEHWKKHLSTTLERLQEAYRLCLEAGDLIYARTVLVTRLSVRFLCGHELGALAEEAESAASVLRHAHADGHLKCRVQQPIAQLLGRTPFTVSLDDAEFEEEAFLASLGQAPMQRSLFYVAKIRGLYLFGHVRECLLLLDEMEAIARGIPSMPEQPEAWFFMALTLAQALRRKPRNSAQEKQYASYGETLDELENQLRVWADHGPENHAHKLALLTAERARGRGDFPTARRSYKQAIGLAADQGFVHHEALANELFGRFWLQWDEPDYARIHLLHARTLYLRWGAIAKVRHLEDDHRELLAGERRERRPSGSIFGFDIDLDTVLKASRAISGELRLEKLLETMMRIVIESAGAQQGRLVLERHGAPYVAVDAAGLAAKGSIVVRRVGGDDVRDLASEAVIRFVGQHGSQLVLGDASHDERFAADPHVVRHRVRSVLCVPVRTRGETSGILYLENNLVSHAFTQERLEILQMLLAQATISLENAVLFDELSREVSQRQQAEEKLSRQAGELRGQNAELERFTHAVSHELKSPLVTIRGFTGAVQHDLERGDAARAEEDCARILTAAETMQLLLGDLVELSRVGRRAGSRERVPLGEIAHEAARLVAAPLTERGVTLVIDPDLPVVAGERRQLLEVLRILIGNAVKFMGDESAPRIELGAGDCEQGASWYVRDNGIGIDPRYHERIFRFFERLDPTIAGTGTGLPLARRILEAHGGKLWVESEGEGQGSTFRVLV